MSKKIIICADDFSQNEDISEGILSLARLQRINAISCLVNTPYWSDFYPELFAVKQKNYIGLHLNFTFGQPLSSAWRKYEGEQFYNLRTLLKRLYLRKIKPDTIIAEIKAQIDVFTHSMHIYPDFIDGHQHVQQLPFIREALLAVHTKKMGHVSSLLEVSEDFYDDSLEYSESFFRNTNNGYKDMFAMLAFPKKQALTILGGLKYKSLLVQKQIPTNASFSGVYNFKKAKNYRKYFQKFLANTKHGGIIMCHPGMVSEDSTDPLYKYRHYEFNYFMSDVFLSDIEDNYFMLTRKNIG